MSLLALLTTSGLSLPETYLTVVGERTGVSTEGTWAAAEGGTQTGRSIHSIKAECSAIALRYTNPYPYPFDLSAAVENEGLIHPATFNGSAQVTVPPGGYVESDLIEAGVFNVGMNLPVRTRYTLAAGNGRPWARFTEYKPSEGFSGGDRTLFNSGVMPSGGSAFAIVPQAILGLVEDLAPTSVAHLGDSISERGNDNVGPIRGFAARSYDAAGIAWSNQAHWGYSTSHFVNVDGTPTDVWDGHIGRGWLSSYTNVVSALGRNDMEPDGRTTQQRHDRAIALWLLVDSESEGAGLAVTTVTPKTTSTDNWATLANQAVDSSEVNRSEYNVWLRDGAPMNLTTLTANLSGDGVRVGEPGHPVNNIIDIAATVEDGGSDAPTGKWSVVSDDTGMDGTHPGAARHALMRVPVEEWVLSLINPSK